MLLQLVGRLQAAIGLSANPLLLGLYFGDLVADPLFGRGRVVVARRRGAAGNRGRRHGGHGRELAGRRLRDGRLLPGRELARGRYLAAGLRFGQDAFVGGARLGQALLGQCRVALALAAQLEAEEAHLGEAFLRRLRLRGRGGGTSRGGGTGRRGGRRHRLSLLLRLAAGLLVLATLQLGFARLAHLRPFGSLFIALATLAVFRRLVSGNGGGTGDRQRGRSSGRRDRLAG